MGWAENFAGVATGLYFLAAMCLLGFVALLLVRFFGGGAGGLRLFTRKGRVEARHLVIRGPHYPRRVLRVRRWPGLPAMPRRKSGRWGR